MKVTTILSTPFRCNTFLPKFHAVEDTHRCPRGYQAQDMGKVNGNYYQKYFYLIKMNDNSAGVSDVRDGVRVALRQEPPREAVREEPAVEGGLPLRHLRQDDQQQTRAAAPHEVSLALINPDQMPNSSTYMWT